MRRSLLVISAMALALLLPAVATAAVVVNNGISVNFQPAASNVVYLDSGPGYLSANQSNYIGVSGNNEHYTNMSIFLNAVPGSGYVVLTNVLEIYNASTSTSSVTVWINGTLPSGVILYGSSTLQTFNGTAPSGTLLLGGSSISTSIHLTSHGAAEYLGFKLTGTSTGSATINLQYTIS
ncbi:MAG: hypothetical protein M1129_03525 [Candidatus Thermoplasmatota archaeon]|nr:hypothetical protein [Candidatus Thermoplasmatota archaeon]